MDIAVDISSPYQGNSCNLSNPKYDYDFVISTTQASINSDLCMYLHNNTLPCNYFCFLSISLTGTLGGVKPANPVKNPSIANAVVPITLEDLVAKTGGVDPFKIPRGTPHIDLRVQALTKVGFAVGVKVRMGLPPGVEPKDLPPILELGDLAQQATFNILCSDFHVVENEAGNSAIPDGKWNAWKQPPGHPWTLKTRVSLFHASLDNQLNGSAHFTQNPAKKQRLLSKLQNLSSTSFSLQQLLLDMDNATVQSVPVIEGMKPGSRAHLVVSGQLGNIWAAFTKKCACPPISVVAVPQTSPDSSKFHLTSFDLQVNRVKDSNGDAVKNPTKEQLAATTLDYRCTTRGTQLPPPKPFSWNWVEPTSINSESGVVAIKKQVFVKYLLDAMIPQARKYCITTDTVVGNRRMNSNSQLWADWSLTTIDNQTPDFFLPNGDDVLCVISYSAGDDPDTVSTRGSVLGSDRCLLNVVPGYESRISLVGNRLVIRQDLVVNIRFECSGVSFGPLHFSAFDKSCTPFHASSVDEYELSVGQTGFLQITHTRSSPELVTGRLGGIHPLFQPDELVERIRSAFPKPKPIEFTSINAAALQNFVFPGGKVFTYKDVRAAPSGDLLCSLTYVDPDEAITSPAMLKIPAAKVEDDALSAPVPASKPAATTTPASLTFTTEMMQSYVPGEIVKQSGKFEALQTQDGHSILLSLSSANVLQAIVEHSGASSTGWRIQDLSSNALSSTFASDKSAVVKTFGVNQSAVDGTISLAMVVTSGGTDHLLLSLYNHNSTAAWMPAPNLSWKSVPFDAASTSGTAISIAGVMFAESDATHKQHIIVDVDRSASDAVKLISRFYVNPLATDKHWTSHDVPVDIQDGNYQSCIGRFQNEVVDGVFTCGVSGTAGQLVYVPISNAFGSGPPASRTLSLPGNATASAIATARAFNNSTDLYAVGGQTLFWFPANSQAGQSVATEIFSDSIFQGTTELSAMTHGGITTIWGRNSSYQIYYSSCPNTQLGMAASWSTPLPLMSGIESMSAFVNRTGYSNTIFASGGTSLWRLVQASETTAKLWRQESLVIEAPPQAKATAFNSYTTTIQLVDTKNMPAGDASVSVTAPCRTPVYINGLYYVLSSTPITVSSDKTGTLTIVENTHNTLNGTSITATCGGQATVIDPSHKHFQKITSLDTATSLGAAKISKNVVAGGTYGTPVTAPLIDPSTPTNDIQNAATTLGNLNTVYGAIKNPNAPLKVAPKPAPPKPVPEHTSSGLFGSICDGLEDVGHAIEVGAGDVLQALKSAAETVVHIVKEAASDVWHFVTTIAGKVYHAVLSTVDAVVGAVEWVFNAIKTAIEDVIRFLELLLDWEDITRTKNVICNISKLFMQGQIDLIASAKPFFDQEMNALVAMINNWAGDTSWTDTIGQATTQPLSANCHNPSSGQTSGSQMLSNHYKNNASSLTLTDNDASDSGVEELVNNLLTALENEGKTLTAAYNNLKNLAHHVSSTPLQDSLKQLLAIIADVFISTVGNVGDAILDLLTSVASSAMHLLDTKFHIPIVSDILSDLGISEPSLLDLFCWIAAVAYTVVYKINHDSGPFPENDDVKALISADSWHTLQTILGVPPPQEELSYISRAASYIWSAPKEISASTKKTIYLCLHSVGGLVDLLNIFVIPLEADGSSDSKQNPFSGPMSILNYLHIACNAVSGLSVSQDPISNEVLKAMHYRNIAVKVVAGPVLKKFLKADGTNRGFPALDKRGMGALVKVVVGYWGLFVTAGHLYELSHESAGSNRTAAILMEVGSILGEVGSVAYCEAVNDPDPTTREIPLLVVAGVGLIETGLELSLLATVD